MAGNVLNEPIVTIKQGKLKGVIQQSVLGLSYLAFKGIPYAAPPIGELRFKDPEPPSSWSDIRDASQNGDVCAQFREHDRTQFVGSEDCLYLNVYTTSLSETRPVIIWIHGGAFLTGTANDTSHGPDYLITKDIVLVCPGYRLGAFGFLNLGDKVAPGNQGLKDVIAALEWVKENIAIFGGDPNNITVSGVSAGSALAHWLCISPVSKGLFQKAILQSGLGTCPWATKSSRPENGFKLASLLGLNSKDPSEVVEFLRKVPCDKIVRMQSQIVTPEDRFFCLLPFSCNTDDIADKPVLPLPLDELVENDLDVTLMLGCTSHEFIMFLKDKSKETLEHYEKYLSTHLKYMLRSEDPADLERLTKHVRDSYFGGKPIDESHIAGVVDILTNIYFAHNATRLAESRAKRKCAPTYLYRFSYVGSEKSSTDIIVKERVMRGASHVDDKPYLFYLPPYKAGNPDPPAIGTPDRITIERLTRIWANFAKTGNPTPVHDEYITTTWRPVTENDFSCLDIGDDLKMMPVQSDLTKF